MPFYFNIFYVLVLFVPCVLYSIIGKLTSRVLRCDKSKIFKANVLLLIWIAMFFSSLAGGFSTCMCGHIAGIGHCISPNLSAYILYSIAFVLLPMLTPFSFFFIFFAMCSYRGRRGEISRRERWVMRLENFLVSLAMMFIFVSILELIWNENWILMSDVIIALLLAFVGIILIFAWKKFSKITPLICASAVALFAFLFALNLKSPNPEKDGVKGVYTAPQKVYEYDRNNDALDLNSRGLVGEPRMNFSLYKFIGGANPTIEEIFAPQNPPPELSDGSILDGVNEVLISEKISKGEFEKMRANILGLVSLIDSTSETKELRGFLQDADDLVFAVSYSESDYGGYIDSFVRGKIISFKNRCFYNIEIRANKRKGKQ